MEKLLSCDWGTSNFRLRLVEAETLKVIVEEENDGGVERTFNLWKQSAENQERLFFYQAFLLEAIKKLEYKTGATLQAVPVIMSGMASSTIGMIDIPYKELPFLTDGSDLRVEVVKTTNDFKYDMLIISGAKTADDVMRGEETKLVGCIDDNDKEEHLYILPGTHSKHIIVKNGRAVSFKTYMTGELFNLLSRQSILSPSVDGNNTVFGHDIKSFEEGVSDSVNHNLLHACFLVRTNHLFKKFSRSENYHYLSGLLIGSELRELTHKGLQRVTLVSNETFKPLYQTALTVLKAVGEIRIVNGDEALIRGQFKIAERFIHQAVFK